MIWFSSCVWFIFIFILQVDFHYQSLTEPAKIRKLVSQVHKTTGQIVKKRPRALVNNSAGLIEIQFTRPLCLELFRDYKELGRFMLRIRGATIAAGLVTQVSHLLSLFLS